MRTIDKLYVSLANRKPFFSHGWGDPQLLEHILSTDPLRLNHGPAAKVPSIEIDWSSEPTPAADRPSHQIGRFQSPFRYEWSPRGGGSNRGARSKNERIVHTLPEPIQEARIQLILPPLSKKVENPPLVLHFAATGDEGFARRRMALAEPLSKLGIASAILENPFYGSRRMPGRDSSNSATVQELLQMSRAAQDEALALLRYFHTMGFRRLGVTGVSMGGYMALAVSARHPEPLAVAACIPSHSASPVYTEGILSSCCDWQTLERTNPFADRYSARELLGHVLDASDLRHLAPPPAPETCVIVGGRRDAYIPAYSTAITHNLRPGSQLHWIDMGHVTSFILGRGAFVNAIRESFQRLDSYTNGGGQSL
ncbi:MAG: alpha/beta hydrolase family protein [bacterium]|nr:alpha/beta hydrolase family protein [bacterium]